MNDAAARWIRRLALEPHPEGGWYRETFRSPERLPAAALPARFGGERSLVTRILYLLAAGERSRFHRLLADEAWCHHAGGPFHLHLLGPTTRLVLSEEAPQADVAHGTWFAAEPAPGAEFALAGCIVAPGFELEDFELAGRDALLREHPEERELVLRFTGEPEARAWP